MPWAVQLKSLQTWVVWLQLLNWHRKLSWTHTRVCWQLSWRQQSCLLPALTRRKYSIYANVLRTEFSCAYHGLLASPTQQLSIDNCINWQLSIFCLWSEKGTTSYALSTAATQSILNKTVDRQDATPNRIQEERKTKSLHSRTTTVSSSCPYGRNTSKYGKSS